MLRTEFLLTILLVGSVVFGWQETTISVTNEDCVNSIIRLTKYYDLMMTFSDDKVPKNLQEKLTPVFQEAKGQLTKLLPLAREQLSFQAFPHELRLLSSTRVYCPRELSLTIAQIFYNAEQQVAGFEFHERLIMYAESQNASGISEPQTTTSQPGPGKQEQPSAVAIPPTTWIQIQCNRCLKTHGKMLKSLARIDSKIRAVDTEVREIARALAEQTAENGFEETTTPLLKDYPLRTEIALAKAEHRLSTDNFYKSNLINDLAIYEAPDARSNVVILMQKIMSNSVAANYSLYKVHGKEPFENLELYDVIKRIIWNRFGQSFDVVLEMNHGIKAWLRRAPLRLAREHRKNTIHSNANDLEMAFEEVEAIDNTDDLKTINYN